jgi:hypothetical protein
MARRFDIRSLIVVLVMVVGVVGVVAVYLPWSAFIGHDYVVGADHVQLHARRMRFAQENLFGPAHTLPAWYPRELMGTPYRANLQNFPWIPTRLIVLVLVDPQAALGVGAAMSAALAAIFTFLFCRRLGFGRVASTSAGWTFACCGFYAARVLAGHLPLLEAFPALPALLWLTDRAIDPTRRRANRIDWSLIALGFTATCFALAGHPQLTVYGLAFASLYAVIARRDEVRRGLIAIATMALGVGVAAFALYPMALLAGRTTRVLPLDRAENDLAMPIARLAGLLFPWKDGWPPVVRREPNVPFSAFPNYSYFWDTVCYIGWAPVLAVVGLLIYVIVRRAMPARRATVLAIMGVLALVLSLPAWQQVMSSMPGTFLRSPARLMYVVSFALAIALGAAIHFLLASPKYRALLIAVVTIVLAAHVADLTRYDRQFIVLHESNRLPLSPQERDGLVKLLREGRVGIDYTLHASLNRELDDIGFFDSIILAKPYRFVIDTSGLPERTNVQNMNGGEMSRRTLRAGGAVLLWTEADRPDLTPLQFAPGESAPASVHKYAVRFTAQRCEFFSVDRVQFMSEREIHDLLRTPTYSLEPKLLLSNEVKPASLPQMSAAELNAELRYRRPSSDEIAIHVTTNQPGYARVLESWDTGWRATVDGAEAPVVAGNDAFIAVPVPPGEHELKLVYRTPGATMGAVISIVSAALLLVLAFTSSPGTPGED